MIDKDIKKVVNISQDELNTMKNLSAYGLPNTPANSGMKAPQVKPKFYEFALGTNVSLYTIIKRTINQMNEIFRVYSQNFNEINTHLTTEEGNPHKVTAEELDVYKKNKTDELLTNLKNELTQALSETNTNIRTAILNGSLIANKATNDANGNNIFTTYETIANVNNLKLTVNSNKTTYDNYVSGIANGTIQPHTAKKALVATSYLNSSNEEVNLNTAINNLKALIDGLSDNSEGSFSEISDKLDAFETIINKFFSNVGQDANVIDTLAEIQTKLSELSGSFSNYYTKTESDGRYLPLTGGTITGGISFKNSNGIITCRIDPQHLYFINDSGSLQSAIASRPDGIYINDGVGNVKMDKLKYLTAPTSSNGSTYGAGSSGQVLKSNGTSVYWGTPTDTKNTAGASNTSSKIYLVGATSQGANPQTYSHDTVYVDGDGRICGTAGVYSNKFYAPKSSGDANYSIGASGQVLMSNGTTNYWGAPSGGKLYRHNINLYTSYSEEDEGGTYISFNFVSPDNSKPLTAPECIKMLSENHLDGTLVGDYDEFDSYSVPYFVASIYYNSTNTNNSSILLTICDKGNDTKLITPNNIFLVRHIVYEI